MGARGTWAGISDEMLVEQIQGGESEAFPELVGRYQGRIINFVYRFIGNYARAEEIAQEVFLRIAAKADTFNKNYRFSTWIYTIAKNLARNELRNITRRPEGYRIRDEDWNEEALRTLQSRRSQGGDPSEEVSSAEIKSAIEEALARLDPNWRAALVMKEYDRMTYEEIAQALSVAQGTVKSWIHRAKESLALKMKDKGII